MDMPKVSGQFGQMSLDVNPGLIPSLQRFDGKAVPQVMKPWPMMIGGSA